jgi:transketolase
VKEEEMLTDNVKQKCREIRKQIFIQAYHAGGAHMGAAFSVTDILGTLYFADVLRYRPDNPNWSGRDKLILSKGHAGVALYATLALAGYFDIEHLKTFCQVGSNLGGHPKINEIPGVEASTGALGHGLSFGIGIAYANKVDKKDSHVYVILGDGECQEGSIWEGALSAPTLELDNLTVIVDHNKLQAMDNLEKIVHMKPFADKWKAFGWNVLEIDGHNYDEIREALLTRKSGIPTLIVANTIKGKGVSFMENIPIWHYRMPNEQELPILMKELGLTENDLKVKEV